MNILQEKNERWLEKVSEGNKHYTMIARGRDDNWYYVNDNHAEQIISLETAINRGKGVEIDYQYKSDIPEDDRLWCAFLIKDESEMIIEDNNGFYAFGIQGVSSPAKDFFVTLDTDSKHVFIHGEENKLSFVVVDLCALREGWISFCERN